MSPPTAKQFVVEIHKSSNDGFGAMSFSATLTFRHWSMVSRPPRQRMDDAARECRRIPSRDDHARAFDERPVDALLGGRNVRTVVGWRRDRRALAGPSRRLATPAA
jgi:hypothetical protein